MVQSESPSNTRMAFRSIILCLLLALGTVSATAQSAKQFFLANDHKTASSGGSENGATPVQPPEKSNRKYNSADATTPERAKPQVRVVRLPIASGAELLTIYGRLDGIRNANGAAPEVPLISGWKARP